MSRRDFGKKVVASICGLVMLVQAVVLPVSVYADVDSEYVRLVKNAMQMMNDAAKMQLLTQKLQRCLSITDANPDGILGTGSHINNNKNEVWGTGMVFENSFFDNDTAIGTGYYLEAILDSNKTVDGQIYCGEGGGSDEGNGLFGTFVETLKEAGVVDSHKGVICDKNDPAKPGILARAVEGAVGGSGMVSCNPTGATGAGASNRFYRNSGWDAYLQSLYEEWVQKTDNKYAVPYANIGDYGGTTSREAGATAYYLWVKEISVFCSGYDPSPATGFEPRQLSGSGGTFGTDLLWVGVEANDGAAITEVEVGKGGKGGSGGAQDNSFGGNLRTCDELIAAANAVVPNVQAEYRDILMELCRDEINSQIAEIKEAIGERAAGDEGGVSESDQGTLDEIAAFEGSGNDRYIVGDGSGGWQCADVKQWSFLSAIEQEGYIDSDRNNVSSVDDFMQQCNEGAGAFSWIVCPLLKWLVQVIEGTFDIIEDFLMVNPAILDTEAEGRGTYTGWQAFRDIANVLLVILFIVLILSQVTGFGIDNYGIKKMLPRLIVIGILLNLSFIICQLAVDLSNIVGSNAYAFIKGIADNNMNYSTGAGAAIGVGLGGVFVGIIAIVVIAFVNPVILLPVLLAVISGVIAVLFMFLLLGVRQAAVVMMVIVAPLAFVANILPNTAGIFKKWWNVFKTLLLLYPICGLIMGMGYFGSKVLMSLNTGELGEKGNILGFMFAIVALILLFAPIFFIPKLVKGAFDGLGKVGAAMTGLGGKLGGKVTGAAKPAMERGMKNGRAGQAHEARVANRDYKIAKKNDDRVLDGRLGSGRTSLARRLRGKTDLSEKEKMRLARAVSSTTKRKKELGNVDRLASPGALAAAEAALEESQLDEAVSAKYAVNSKDSTLSSVLSNDDTANYTSVETAWNNAGSMEEKVALAQMMAETSGGRANLRKLMNGASTTINPADRLVFGRAMQRQRNFATLDKKAEDVADFFRNPNTNMAGATAGLRVSGAAMGGYDPGTFAAIASAKAAAVSTAAATYGVGSAEHRKAQDAKAAFDASVRNAIDDGTVLSGTKISGDIDAYAASNGIVSSASATQAIQATQHAAAVAAQAAQTAAQTAANADLAAINAQLSAPRPARVNSTGQYAPTIILGNATPPPVDIQALDDGTFREVATGNVLSAQDMARKYKPVK